jgi:hypothetical protein
MLLYHSVRNRARLDHTGQLGLQSMVVVRSARRRHRAPGFSNGMCQDLRSQASQYGAK